MFRIGSIFIPVSDVEQSLHWYTTYFDAQEIGRWEGGIGLCLPDRFDSARIDPDLVTASRNVQRCVRTSPCLFQRHL